MQNHPRDNLGKVIDCCPWSYRHGRWGQEDGMYGISAMYDERTAETIHNMVYEVAENQGFEDYTTKQYPILDDDGALWFTVQISESEVK
jgi:hypothetical protein